jgi:amidase
MQRLGALVIDHTDVVTVEQLREPELEVLLYEFKADLNSYLAGRGPDVPVRSLQDVIAFNERHRDRVMPFFGQELMLKAQEKGPLTSEAYLQALQTNLRLARSEGIDATLRKHDLDAIVAPSGAPAWVTDLISGDHSSDGSSTPAAVAGYPHVTVPAGFVFGLPVGVSFFGGAYQEPRLISFAFSFEQATHVRRPPAFLPTADLGR